MFIICFVCLILLCRNATQTIESIPISRSDNSLVTRSHDRVDSAAVARMPRSMSADFSPPSYSTICESSDETFEPENEGTARSRAMPARKAAAASRQKSAQPRSKRANSRKPKPMDCGDIDVLE